MEQFSPPSHRVFSDWLAIGEIRIADHYQAFEHFGIGLNYNCFELDVGVDKSNWRGDVETIYDGVYVYASYYY